MKWNVSLSREGAWHAKSGKDVISQPRLKNHDVLTAKAFARAIMLQDPKAEVDGDEGVAILIARLKAEGFNQ